MNCVRASRVGPGPDGEFRSLRYSRERRNEEILMGVISVLWGILSLLWAMLAFIPLLGWGNWFMIPFAVVGAIIGGLGALLGENSRAKAGLVLNVLAIAIGVFRLTIGGGLI